MLRSYSADAHQDGPAESTAQPDAEWTSVPSHKATVEDDVDEDAADRSTGSATPATTPGTQAAEPAAKPESPQPQAQADKYWLSERSIGEFSRSFKFASRVDQDAVTAHLDNGVLTVTVPKAKAYEPLHIAVN